MSGTAFLLDRFKDAGRPCCGCLPAHRPEDRNWFAAFTAPQGEFSVVRHFDAYQVESFLPTFESVHVWKNRQRKKIIQPLFPSYVFVHVATSERRLVFRAPGVLRLLGGNQGPISIPASEIDLLRSEGCRNRLEPYGDLVIGERVRIKCGPMQGIEGTLVRKSNSLRFVLSISLINQHAALEIGAQDVEPIRNAEITKM
jgi:transcription termination/antitermination protein NusG